MIELISILISIFKEVKEGLSDSKKFLKEKRRKEIIQNLVILKFILSDVIKTAEDIFSSIEVINKSRIDSIVNAEMKLLYKKTLKQYNNLHAIKTYLLDSDLDFILNTFDSELIYNIKEFTDKKSSRLYYFLSFDLKASDIRKKYKSEYIKKGLDLLSELKKIQVSFTKFLKENATFNDILK